MVMNTFRSKLRRRRDELFRRGTDETNDEWQFVAFNASVFPNQDTLGARKPAHRTPNNNNGNPPSTNHPQTPVPTHKSALRPWAVKRASWHDTPPVPPHNADNGSVSYRLPLGPDSLSIPSPIDESDGQYPGSMPSWFGAQGSPIDSSDYPMSVPNNHPRPSHLDMIYELPVSDNNQNKPVRHRLAKPPAVAPRPKSYGADERSPPQVPPHGRPIVPPHTLPLTDKYHPAPPPPRVPAHATIPSPPPPPPPHNIQYMDVLNDQDSLLSLPLPPTPQTSSEESSSPSDSSPLGDKIGVGSGASKEPRKSDAGNGSSCLSNHQPNNGGSLDDDQHPDDHDHASGDQPSPLPSSDAPPNNLGKSQAGQKKKSASSINRSESCKEKQHSRKQTRENRKNSDPNIPTSKTGDVDAENPLNFQSGSSSNSSLSQSQESPGNSAEVQAYASVLDNDSDIEAEADLPDWKSRLLPEELDNLTSKDRKRQETINEFFHTEQSHVRTLKVLQSLFYQPLRQSNYLSPELLDRLFPNLDQILRFHSGFNKAMKKRRHDCTVVESIGDILSSMFVGEDGVQFQQSAAEFVAYQSCALEDLKQRQKREPKLAIFLQDQENHHHCRRLQLKDMLPAGFQRLTKYPLLLESLLSYTDKKTNSQEHTLIAKSLERSREILAYVNAAVQDAENHRRLIDIQKKLDQSSLVKNKHGNCDELRGELDLTKHHLIYDGQLTWKTRGQKNIDLQVLILEDCVVLLQKDNDKFVLKYHSINKASGKDDNKLNHSPIIKFGTFIFRPVATDKCAFFIVLTQSTLGAQIYELVTISSNERKVWLRHLHEAQVNYESREGRNRRSHSTQQLPDPEDHSQPTEQLKDVEDTVDAQANEQAETVESCDAKANEQTGTDSNAGLPTVASPLSPEPNVKKTELLRRKDVKIRQELEEKQHLIADILNIPRQDFESVADMASEVALGNKEPRELVLGAIFQAKKLQETINDAQTVKECDVISAQCSRGDALPLYPAPMDKLLNISGTLTQLLNSLLTLVSERDDERERMRKELLASRDRIHQMHMLQNKTDAPEAGSGDAPPVRVSSTDTSTPQSSRPNSYMSIGSSEHCDTTEPQTVQEEVKDEQPTPESSDSTQQTKCEWTDQAPPGDAESKTLSLQEDALESS